VDWWVVATLTTLWPGVPLGKGRPPIVLACLDHYPKERPRLHGSLGCFSKFSFVGLPLRCF